MEKSYSIMTMPCTNKPKALEGTNGGGIHSVGVAQYSNATDVSPVLPVIAIDIAPI
jgi:hypothetical protein